MLATLQTSAVFGVEAYPVQVEVDVAPGLPGFTMVGLPDASVRESRDRVRSAIRNCGFEFPLRRITINLAPADVRKAGAAFDLPIALGILAAAGFLERRELASWILLGELSLDGAIQPTRGVLSIAAAARRRRLDGLILPVANACEAGIVSGLRIVPVRSLDEGLRAFRDPGSAPSFVASSDARPAIREAGDDFSDVRGQEVARRALEIAAAGGHNLLMVGPPGAGKTMMARRLPGILPEPTFDEAVETTTIHSVAGLLPPGRGLLWERPFRAPHHTISDVALVGGGVSPRAGEVSLAHNGVLFLDELPEFQRRALEVLRQPLEDGCVRIARASRTAVFPARFVLVGAMNPCPCGHLGDPKRACRCDPPQVARYRTRISGPLADRIDLIVPVPAVPISTLAGRRLGECSRAIRDRVVRARERQTDRLAGSPARVNADLTSGLISRHCTLDPRAAVLLERASERFGLSARGHSRVLKVARTIADLDGNQAILDRHMAEALQYREPEIFA